ncbi:uncharacterized protein LOC117100176 isoform X2 [Anneissia japonica]|uniref:uncharacterized protein LOC117100176 isoform X2 n=1 Tax=Anneissia japonica TaxID=1529436 RepID=UPI0014254AFC|nr:uncharacterized protein LOC117100176 isoform X2 [Anneissia japonica]
MPINYKDNQRFVIPLLNEGPGRRTGWELKKEARKDSDGFEIFDDYWSDSSDQSSISADSTVRSIISTKRKTISTPSNKRKSLLLKPMSSFSSGGLSTKSSNADNSAITTKENTAQHASPDAVREGDPNGSLSIIDTSKAPNSALQSFKTKKRLTFSTEEHLKQARNEANECVEVEPVITNVGARHQHDVDHNSGEELNNTLVADEANEPKDSMANGVGASADKDNGQVEINKFQTSPQAEKIISDRGRRSVAFRSHTVSGDVLETGNSDVGTGPEYSSFVSFKHKSIVKSTEINFENDNIDLDTDNDDDGFDIVEVDTSVYTQSYGNSRKSLANSTKNSKSESDCDGHNDKEPLSTRRGTRKNVTEASQLVNEPVNKTSKAAKSTKNRSRTQKGNTSSPASQMWGIGDKDDDEEKEEEELTTSQPKQSSSYRNKGKIVTENIDHEIGSGISDGINRDGKAVLSAKKTGRTRKKQVPLQEKAKSEIRKKPGKKTFDEGKESLLESNDLENNSRDSLVVDILSLDDDDDDDVVDNDTGVYTNSHKIRKSGRLAESRRKSKLTSGSESGGISDGEKVTVSTKNKRRVARANKTQASKLVSESETDTAKNEKNTGKSKNGTQKENVYSPGRRKSNEDDDKEEEEELSTNQPKQSEGYRDKGKTVDEIRSDIDDGNDRYGKTLSVKRTGRTRKKKEPLQKMAKSEKRKKSGKKTSDEETRYLMKDDDLKSNDYDDLVVNSVPSDDDVVDIDIGVYTNSHKNSKKSGSLAKSTRKSNLTSGSESGSISDGEKVTKNTKNRGKGTRKNKTQANQLVSETGKTTRTTAKSTNKTQKDNASRQARRKWYDIEDDVEVEEEVLQEKEVNNNHPKKRNRNKKKTDTRIMDGIGDSVEEVVGDEENLEELITKQLMRSSGHKNHTKMVTGNMDDKVNDKEVETLLSVKRTGRTRKKQEPLQEKAKPNLRKKSGKKASDEDTENLLEDNDDHDALVVDTMLLMSSSKGGPRQKSKSKQLQETSTGDIEHDIELKVTDDGFTETSIHRRSTAKSLNNSIRDAITEPATKGGRKKRSKSLYNPENSIFERQENDDGTVKSATMITGSENKIQVKKKNRQRKSTVRFSLDEELHSTSPRRSVASKTFSASSQATSTDDYDDDDDFPLQITKSSGLHQTECADDLDRALENDAMPSTKKQPVKRKKNAEIFETGAEEDGNEENSPTAKHVKKALKQKSPSPNTRQRNRGGGKASSSSTAVSSEEGELIKKPRRGNSQRKRNFDQTDLLTHSQFGVDDVSRSFTPARVPSDSTPIKSILKSGGQRKTGDSNVENNANLTMKFFEVPRKKAYIIDPPEMIEDGVRRTKRHRVKPLEYWRNERPIYERRKSGGFSLSGIQSPTIPTPSPPSVKPRRKRKVIPKTPHNLSVHTDLSDVELEEKVNPTVTVINPSNDEEVEIDAIVTGEMNQFYGPNGKPSKKTDNISICKSLYQKSFSAGELIIRPLQEKGLQFVRNDTVVFRVLRGKVAVQIHETVSVLESGAMFFIPKGNVYNIKNLRKDEAKLVFIQVKGSIKP